MDKNQLVNNFYISHSIWVEQCAYNLVGDKEKSLDLVQDTLITLLELPEERFERLRFGQYDLNTYWFYVVMKNRHINNIKKQKETYQDEVISTEEYNNKAEEKELKFERINKDINDYLTELESDPKLWFNSKLFRLYIESGKSMDQLAVETRISKSTIFTTIKNMRVYLKEKFQEQYNQLNDE